MLTEGHEMINMETVAFIGRLNELAEMTNTENGETWILPFSECTSENQDNCLFYDDRNPIHDNNDKYAPVIYDIVLNKCVDECHHDIISTYKDMFYDIDIVYCVPTDSDSYISASSLTRQYQVHIHDGKWDVID
jgi:hypothetical protein